MSRARRIALIAVLAAGLSFSARAEDRSNIPTIPYVPTPENVVERMMEIADVGADDFVLDLGAGDGRIAIAAAKRGARALGVEIKENLVAEARGNAAKAGVADRVEFRLQDLFDTDVAPATVVTLYLPTAINMRLRPRLLSDLKPGSRIVAHDFALGDWRPDLRERMGSSSVFLWVVPAEVAGVWKVETDSGPFTVEFGQYFQEVNGNAIIGHRTYRLEGPRLRGDKVEFEVPLGGARVTFRGTVQGDRMAGEAGGRTWRAARTGDVPFAGR